MTDDLTPTNDFDDELTPPIGAGDQPPLGENAAGASDRFAPPIADPTPPFDPAGTMADPLAASTPLDPVVPASDLFAAETGTPENLTAGTYLSDPLAPQNLAPESLTPGTYPQEPIAPDGLAPEGLGSETWNQPTEQPPASSIAPIQDWRGAAASAPADDQAFGSLPGADQPVAEAPAAAAAFWDTETPAQPVDPVTPAVEPAFPPTVVRTSSYSADPLNPAPAMPGPDPFAAPDPLAPTPFVPETPADTAFIVPNGLGGPLRASTETAAGQARWDDGPGFGDASDRLHEPGAPALQEDPVDPMDRLASAITAKASDPEPEPRSRSRWVIPVALIGLLCLGLGLWGLFGPDGDSDDTNEPPSSSTTTPLVLPADAGDAPEDATLVDRWGPAVVTVTAPSCVGPTIGAGVVLADGRILTTSTVVGSPNDVVIEGLDGVSAGTPTASASQLVILDTDASADVAGVGWQSTEAPRVGASLTALVPRSDGIEGVRLSVIGSADGQLLIDESAPSGSPLFNEAGDLVGLVLGRSEDQSVVAASHPRLGTVAAADSIELDELGCDLPASSTTTPDSTEPGADGETDGPATDGEGLVPGDPALLATGAALAAPDGSDAAWWFGEADFGSASLAEGDDPVLDAQAERCRETAAQCDFLFGASRPDSEYQAVALDCGGRGPSFYSCALGAGEDLLPDEPTHAAGNCLVLRRDDTGQHFQIDCDQLHDAEIQSVSLLDGDVDSEEARLMVSEVSADCEASAGGSYQVIALPQPDESGNSVLCLSISIPEGSVA